MKRRRFTAKQHAEIFLKQGGICPKCKGKILPVEKKELDHIIPIANGGEDTPENMQYLHAVCHREKTKEDAGRIAKGRRQFNKKYGFKTSRGRPIPGSRNSPWKKKINGEVIPRSPKEER